MQPLKYAWFNGSIVPFEKASCSVLTHALNYGTSVFEGIRAFATGDNRKLLFRNREHVIRLRKSAHMIGLSLPYDDDTICKAIEDVVRLDWVDGDVYIRPIAYVGFGGINLDYSRYKVEVAIAALTFDSYFEPGKKGLRVCVSSWRRVSGDTSLPLAKAGGNYLNSCLAKFEASRNGYDEAIFLDGQGNVCEGTGENIFLVRKDKLITPPTNSSILEGITRDTVLRIAQTLGISYEESNISRGELYRADEVFFTGTAAGITPIIEIDGRTVGNGEEGGYTRMIREEYDNITHGRKVYSEDWLTWVGPDGYKPSKGM
ncbi:MAG: branched-chain amino acid transaminase [Thermoprotei archaeon]